MMAKLYRALTLCKLFASLFISAFCKCKGTEDGPDSSGVDCLSWRLNVEINNLRNWWTVPEECVAYVEYYMLGGQYETDLEFAVGEMISYMQGIDMVGDGMDAWVLDVDDTALSNLEFYKERKFGGLPYDRDLFNNWALSGRSVAVSPVLKLYKRLLASGFKVFFMSGRDESQRIITEQNLLSQGYNDYTDLLLRGHAHKGKSAVAFKSYKRAELMENGYRIWGNVGDQWTDITGDCVGHRTFKLPNPMYYVP